VSLDKTAILEALRARVIADLDAMTESQVSTAEGATHAEARAEGTKDMRSTETSYLARGLAKRVEDMREEARLLANLRLRSFDDDDPIALSALVTVEDEDGATVVYFVAPGGAGLKIEQGNATVSIVTPKSPLGRALVGKRCDDDVELRTPKGARELAIIEVS
jgi:transcription elongation GreA/GreB family factor